MSRTQHARVAEHGGREVAGGDAEHRKVRIRIASKQVRSAFSAVRQGHLDARRAFDDMAVREDEPVGRKDEAGAVRLPLRMSAVTARMSDRDADDRRGHSVNRPGHRFRVVVEQIFVGSAGREGNHAP